ncbi:MAG: hypothetical protein LQ337_005614 [Flavoplaca oasis]|nr:MAG: hypothetical protein LQ337_005614 [Flavoplaca oasis]
MTPNTRIKVRMVQAALLAKCTIRAAWGTSETETPLLKDAKSLFRMMLPIPNVVLL